MGVFRQAGGILQSQRYFLTGHNLIWHQQTPDWVFEDDDGDPASRELLLERMEKHISTIVGHFKGAVPSWDVVNEALNEDSILTYAELGDVMAGQ